MAIKVIKCMWKISLMAANSVCTSDMTHMHNKWVNEDTLKNITSDTQQSNMQDNISRDSSSNQIAVSNEQKENPNYMPIHSNHEEPNENTTKCTRYGRIVKRPDRVTYYLYTFLYICINITHMNIKCWLIRYVYNFIIYFAYFIRRRGMLVSW